MGVVDQDSVCERYRLDVMATKVVDVVKWVGGWLFDRGMEGWDVTVLIADRHDNAQPLDILGTKALHLDLALGRPERYPAALSVAADLYAADERVRHTVQETLRRPTPEITVWGEGRPAESSHPATRGAPSTYQCGKCLQGSCIVGRRS